MVSPMVGYWSVVRPRGGLPVGGYTGGWLAHRWLALSPISRQPDGWLAWWMICPGVVSMVCGYPDRDGSLVHCVLITEAGQPNDWLAQWVFNPVDDYSKGWVAQWVVSPVGAGCQTGSQEGSCSGGILFRRTLSSESDCTGGRLSRKPGGRFPRGRSTTRKLTEGWFLRMVAVPEDGFPRGQLPCRAQGILPDG